jgi:aldose 1-epimerase
MDSNGMKIARANFGTLPGGLEVSKYTLQNRNGLSFSVIPFGAAMTELYMPDRRGNFDNIVLGYDALEDYITDPHNFGGTIGRFANRIAHGKFTLNGKEYRLVQNNGDHHLHGGRRGFNKVLWEALPEQDDDSAGIVFSYVSKNGEENYPGNLKVSVTYRLNNSNELFFIYSAQTDQETPVNLTNHAYWNLKGAGKGCVLDHRLSLNCSHYLEATDELIPTGRILSVRNSPLDFTTEKPIRDDIQMTGNGYDHCLVINESSAMDEGNLKYAARAHDHISGRCMTVFTDQPGMQLYTGNFLDKVAGARGTRYDRHHGFCLETQNFPDAVNRADFPDPYLKPGNIYTTMTMHRFSRMKQP